MKITDSYSAITNWFFGTLSSLLEHKDTVMVGLGGGSSFDSWYTHLLERDDDIFQKIRWCVTDERVNCDISERNDEHIWEVFLKPLFEKY